ncbi:MAG: DUF87 domain-containing protein [Acidobacteria bacterium]|nr:DUF87 domain-containing protein [Acidobacteriota bacterium]MYG27550.1 DUF87 domain-containing protein [Boseongicola sp. SB0677_bin_26]
MEDPSKSIVVQDGGLALAQAQQAHREKAAAARVVSILDDIVRPSRLVGDLISMDYETAEVLVHDSMKQGVGGVPHGCLLIATRMKPNGEQEISLGSPDSHLILLRVLGSSRLPNDIEMQQKRLDAAKRASDSPSNYDEDNKTDTLTLHQIRYAGAHCRILGTFSPWLNPASGLYTLVYGSDISNFYAGQGMKIYKPANRGLDHIVNYTTAPERIEGRIEIGRLRYSASADDQAAPESVPVQMTTSDIVAKRTALFGMTRTGKSNTVKTIADAVFRLRLNGGPAVAQLIIDPEGEYANENAQDSGAIRRLNEVSEGDVVVHSLVERKDDPTRRIMKINFYGGPPPPQGSDRDTYDEALASLHQGKQIINDRLQAESGGYVQAFASTDLSTPRDVSDPASRTRYVRAIFLYRAIIHEAGFSMSGPRAVAKGLFGEKIRKAMAEDDTMKIYPQYLTDTAGMSWHQSAAFARSLAKWISDRGSSYKSFNDDYRSRRGEDWHDDTVRNLLRIFENTRGIQAIRECRQWHDPRQNHDYIQRILDDLAEGRLVILDQALGSPEMNEQSAEQIMWRIFTRQQHAFVNPTLGADGNFEKPPPVIVYVEEAHTLLPRGEERDTRRIWPRIAKEGAKFNIGLVYSTQEPSSVQTNILTNTENWFLSYLNSSDETRQLDKYYDFADFTASVRRTNEPGFIRMRTYSSPYTIPVQIHRFGAPSRATSTP